MVINANTKIAALLKQNPEALEAIISLNPKFEKLRNPILRKLMAGRSSIATASKIAGCKVEDFYSILQPLGFSADLNVAAESEEKSNRPEFLNSIRPAQVKELDVRGVLAGGKDPLNQILAAVKELETGNILKIVNTFEPVPLIKLLGSRGFSSYSEETGPDLVETWFYRNSGAENIAVPALEKDSNDWDPLVKRFTGQMTTVDVRHLEMPGPMAAILQALDSLENGKALFVYHKRIPVFLLPELKERNFEYRIKEIADGNVNMLIFKD